jgi:hypothetical protein
MKYTDKILFNERIEGAWCYKIPEENNMAMREWMRLHEKGNVIYHAVTFVDMWSANSNRLPV